MLANGVLDRSAAVGQLLPDFRSAFENQQRVGEGVIADDVSGFHEFADDVGALLRVASNEKESCMDIVTRENFQQAKRVRIVGAVVVSEGELFCARSEAGKGTTVPLAGGRHRLVADGDERGSRSSGQDWAEHAGIVTAISD